MNTSGWLERLQTQRNQVAQAAGGQLQRWQADLVVQGRLNELAEAKLGPYQVGLPKPRQRLTLETTNDPTGRTPRHYCYVVLE